MSETADLLVTLRDAVNEIDVAVPDMDALVDLAETLQNLRRLTSDARLVEQTLCDRIAKLAPFGEPVPVEGVGTIKIRRRSTKTTWDHDELFRHVTARARDRRRVDTETGEALEAESDAVVRGLRDCMAPSYWRMGKLEDYGLDGDEFREKTPGGLDVQFT